MSFYVIAASLHPRQALRFGAPLALSVYAVGMPWYFEDGTNVDVLQRQAKLFYESIVLDRLPEDIDLRAMYVNAVGGVPQFGLNILPAFAAFAVRILEKASSAADVERMQSAVTEQGTKQKSRQSDLTVLHKVSVRFNSRDRQMSAQKRQYRKLKVFKASVFKLEQHVDNGPVVFVIDEVSKRCKALLVKMKARHAEEETANKKGGAIKKSRAPRKKSAKK